MITFRSNAAAADAVVTTCRAAGVDASAHPLDLVDAEAAAAVVGAAVAEHGGIHTLVHAAGPHVPQVHLSTVSPTDFARHLLEEAAGFFNVVAPALPTLRETKGSIVAGAEASQRKRSVSCRGTGSHDTSGSALVGGGSPAWRFLTTRLRQLSPPE